MEHPIKRLLLLSVRETDMNQQPGICKLIFFRRASENVCEFNLQTLLTVFHMPSITYSLGADGKQEFSKFHHERSSYQNEKKYAKNINRKKDKSSKSGTGRSMKRRYFDIMDTTMSDKPQVIPPLIINSSIPSTSEPPSATSVDEKP